MQDARCKMQDAYGGPIVIRSQLPKQDQLDTLVFVSSVEDLDEYDWLSEYDWLLEASRYGSTDTLSGFSEDGEPINQNQLTVSELYACRMEIVRGDGFINEEQGASLHQLSQPATPFYFSTNQNHARGLVENFTSDSIFPDQNPSDILGCIPMNPLRPTSKKFLIPTDMFIENILPDDSDMDELLEEIALTMGS